MSVCSNKLRRMHTDNYFWRMQLHVDHPYPLFCGGWNNNDGCGAAAAMASLQWKRLWLCALTGSCYLAAVDAASDYTH